MNLAILKNISTNIFIIRYNNRFWLGAGQKSPKAQSGLDYRLLSAYNIEYRKHFILAEAWFGQDSYEAAELRAARDHI
ncbi:MAG: hypothetical protein ABIJ34_04005 [archaeon]